MHRDQERTSPNQLANHTAADYETVATFAKPSGAGSIRTKGLGRV